MTAVRIHSRDYEIRERLEQLGLSLPDLVEVVQRAVAARAGASLNFPMNAAGTLAYIHGTAALRDTLRMKGWEIDRAGNLEATFNPKTGMKIVFQNSDSACDDSRNPKAISDKGPASERAVDLGQMNLFPELAAEDERRRSRENASLWCLFVSVDGDDVRAELSFPKGIEDKQFKDFHDRIYIIKHGEWPGVKRISDDNDTPLQDFEINVTRKK